MVFFHVIPTLWFIIIFIFFFCAIVNYRPAFCEDGTSFFAYSKYKQLNAFSQGAKNAREVMYQNMHSHTW